MDPVKAAVYILNTMLCKPEEFTNQFSIALIPENRHFGGTTGQHAPVFGFWICSAHLPMTFSQHPDVKENTAVPECPTVSWLRPTPTLVPSRPLSQSLR